MRKVRLKKKHWIAAGVISAAAVIFGAAALSKPQPLADTAGYDDMNKAVVSDAPPGSQPVAAVPSSGQKQGAVSSDDGVREPDKEIDFEELFARNSEIIAWISVPGTDIEYPVLESADNAEYLKYDADGKLNPSGAIFMDMANSPDFSDRLIVIYGHNLESGEMFSALHKFADREFFDENREFKLYTPEGMRTYEIIAAYETDDARLLYRKDYSDDAVWENYVGSVFANGDLSANLFEKAVGERDRIVTLSTCVGVNEVTDRRYLVQGVLKKDVP